MEKEKKTRKIRSDYPKNSPGQKRMQCFGVFLSEEERETMRKLAEAAGMSVSEWLRHQGLRWPVSSKIDRDMLSVLGRAICEHSGEVRRIGNNLNQLTRAVNMGETIGSQAAHVLADVGQALTESARLLARIDKAMTRGGTRS